MSKPTVLTLDTLDDRREIWHLLHCLHPRRRVEFLSWCCGQVRAINGGTGPVPHGHGGMLRAAIQGDDAQDQRLTTTIYTELGMLASQQRIEMKEAAIMLEQFARRQSGLSAPDAYSR
jgi:hypothetical protein